MNEQDVESREGQDVQPAVGWHSEQTAMVAASATSYRRMVRTSQPGNRAAAQPLPGSGTAVQHGTRPGDHYIRRLRASNGSLRAEDATLVHSGEQDIAPQNGLSKAGRFLFGRPIASSEESGERLSKVKALALLCADAIASIAYATEQIVGSLAVAGAAAVGLWSMPIAIVITVLIFIVSLSYKQTLQAYPKGGGSYTVSKENMGTNVGLVAGAALIIDYVLNAAVSIAAGVAAIVSAFPNLFAYKTWIALLFLLLITVVNLRGVREAGAAFSAPTYAFIFSVIGIIIIGGIQFFSGSFTTEPQTSYSQTFASNAGELSIYVVLLAFSSGCTAMTGVEAISNGVPVFKQPEVKNASITMNWMAGLLAVMFLGITFLAQHFRVLGVNDQQQTVIDQIARHAYGTGPFYVIFVIATTSLLALAAQTSFSDFPRVAYVLARDKFLPNQFGFRGDRLAFNTGIMVLALLTGSLLILFKAETNALIPLFAIGAFTCFTLSQAGMVLKWRRERQRGWRRGALINGLGAVATGMALLVIAVTKFNSESGRVLFTIGDFKVHEGAWLVVLLIPLLVLMFKTINRHYRQVTAELQLRPGDLVRSELGAGEIRHLAVVPVSTLNRATVYAMTYASSFASKVIAVHVTDDLDEATTFREHWQSYYADSDIHLVIVESPYRALIRPLIGYLEDLHEQQPDRVLTVVLPEFVARRWWEHILHTQTALRLKGALLFHPDIIVTSVPYHIGRGSADSYSSAKR